MFKLGELLVDGRRGDVFVEEPRPVFSWTLESDGHGMRQSGCRLAVRRAGGEGVWDSLWREGSRQVLRCEQRLAPRTAYEAQVWVRAGAQEAASGWRPFAMALGMGEPWRGEWMGGPEGCESPYLRADFQLDAPVRRAVLYCCGLGFSEYFLNGERVGQEVLSPAQTDYSERPDRRYLYPYRDETRKRVEYRAWEVSALLRPGENALGVHLGNGWFNQRRRTAEGELWYGEPRALVELEVELADGQTVHVASGQHFWTAPSPVVDNNLFYGERYDARLEQPGWTLPGFSALGWSPARRMTPPTGALVLQTCPPDRVARRLSPVRTERRADGGTLVDFGVNTSGWVALALADLAPGQAVELRFSEELDGRGALDAQSAGGEEQAPVDAYIASGQEAGRVWHPSFCWHGFRYAQISGPAGWRGGRLWAEEVCAGVRQTGRFECSEPTLNGLFQLYLQSQRTNLHGGVPSDCPHRERLGYTGDGQLTAPAALCCLEMMPLYRKWLRDILDAQCRRTGHVPHTAPFEGGGGGPGGWGCAVALLPWAMYRYQGEVQLLRDCMPAMEAWVGYLERHLDGDGLVACEEEGGWCLGDWCPPGAVELPEPLVNSFFYVKCLEILGASCALLGEAEVAGRWRERAKRVARAMHQRYLKGKDYACATQGANAFALELGYLTEEQQAALLQGLLERLEALGGHLDTGIFGTPVLLYALSRRGHIREALKMLTVPGFPGYAHMMERGATTLWENWSGEASHNHPMFGAAVAWLFEELAGIGQSEGAGGLEELVIAPKGLGLLSHLEAVRPTPLGPVELSWRWEGEEARMRLSLPVGSRAELLLAGVALEAVEPPVPEAQGGGGRLALGSGEYRLHLRRS